jgi:hypothetical protein
MERIPATHNWTYGYADRAVIIRIALESLQYPAAWKFTLFDHPFEDILNGLLSLAILICFTWLLLRVVDFLSHVWRERASHTESKMDDQFGSVHKKMVLKIFIIVNAAFLFCWVLFSA